MKGLRPTRIDWRDRRFAIERHFGAVTAFPDNFNVDLGMRMQDQNADNLPSACTGYACTDARADQEGFLFSPAYHYMKTIALSGGDPNQYGADLRVAAKVGPTIGFLPLDDQPTLLFGANQAYAADQGNWPLELDQKAAEFKSGPYLPIIPITQDYFDAVRTALMVGKEERRAVVVGTRWSPDFENIKHDGILPEKPTGLYWGHAYDVVGSKLIAGQPFLILKTCQGPGYGDKGYSYASRPLFNKLMNELGTYAFVYKKLPDNTTVEQLKAQNATLLEIIARLTATIQNLMIRLKYGSFA